MLKHNAASRPDHPRSLPAERGAEASAHPEHPSWSMSAMHMLAYTCALGLLVPPIDPYSKAEERRPR